MALELQVLTWNRHKHVAELNRSMNLTKTIMWLLQGIYYFSIRITCFTFYVHHRFCAEHDVRVVIMHDRCHIWSRMLSQFQNTWSQLCALCFRDRIVSSFWFFFYLCLTYCLINVVLSIRCVIFSNYNWSFPHSYMTEATFKGFDYV